MVAIEQAFGDILRELRTGKGFSQESLALECGLDRTFISLMERGQRQPSLTTIFQLATALGIRPHELIHKVDKLLESESQI